MSSMFTLMVGSLLVFCAGCSTTHHAETLNGQAALTPSTRTTRELLKIPEPKGKIFAAVYAMRDQTGQYKTAPDSSFSTMVTQGAGGLLVKALKDSGWFIPVEREGLQNLLTERKIVRALEVQPEKRPLQVNLPPLASASILIEGGIVAYETNVRTGGAGAKFLGIGLSDRYRIDQVTVNLRSVDIRDGRVLNSVSTTKTIYSVELTTGVFRFVNYKELLEIEAGSTHNEPVQLCVREAIEAAVVHLIVQGVKDRAWELKNEADLSSPFIQSYLQAASDNVSIVAQ